jgi:hypothetical protein
MDVRVLECRSRDVKLAWNEPLNGNSPILQYIVTTTKNPGESFSIIKNDMFCFALPMAFG